MSLYVIGGANIDIFAYSMNKLIPYDSNPARMSLSFGGVGRNIADNLNRLDEKVCFVTKFGNDGFAQLLKADLNAKGFDLSFAIDIDMPSSMYLAIMNPDNDLELGLSDMRIIETLSIDDIKVLKEVIKEEDYLVLDTNLKSEVLEYITNEFKGTKIADAISVNKVYKLRPIMHKIDLIKCNLIEAEELLDTKLDNDIEIKEALLKLGDQGPKEFLITTKKGVYSKCDKAVYYYAHNAYQSDIKNATGAGDAFIGCYTKMHMLNKGVEERCKMALSSALITIASSESVADISLEKITQKMNELNFIGGEI